MNQSESIAELATALAKAQAAIEPAPKDAQRPGWRVAWKQRPDPPETVTIRSGGEVVEIGPDTELLDCDGNDWSWAYDIFREIPGNPGYAVGYHGSVWSCRRMGRKAGLKETWHRIKTKPNKNSGHKSVCVGFDAGRRFYIRVNRAMLLAFIGPPGAGQESCHNDGNPRNNRLSNLRWDTRSGNIADSIRHGTMRVGTAHPCAKLNPDSIAEIFRLRGLGLSQTRIGKIVGVSQGHVKDILKGRSGSHMLAERSPG